MGISASLGSSALLPAGLGFRNMIINGDFRINQRGFSSSTSGYNFDRWYNEASGGTQTITTQAFSTSDAPFPALGNGTNYIQSVVASQSGVNDYAAIGQKIEGVRLAAGQQVSVSFWAKTTSGTPKVSVEFQQIFGTGGSSGVFTAAPTAFTLSTSWTRYQTTVQIPSISGKTIGANDCLILFLWLSSGSTYSARSNSIGVQNSTIQFWGVQVEQNYQPTPFEQRPIGVELALCQRYFQQFTSTVGDNSFCTGVLYVTTLFLGALSWSPMRAAPIVSFSGSFNLVAAGLANSCTPGSGNITATSCQISGTVTGYPAGNGGTMRMASGAFYSLNAEL